MLFTEKAKPPRVTPPVCPDCHNQPWVCPSCNDFQCACPNPEQYASFVKAQLEGRKAARPMSRQHYGRDGKVYPTQFIDGVTDTKPIDLVALLEEAF